MHDDTFKNGSVNDDWARQPPSKSQRKREATARQALGEQLVKLTSTQLNQIPLSEEVMAAVRLAQTISQRGGRKRQLQYIGKLMRRLDDAEIDALNTALHQQL
jgi:ribosome-associated protein